ncbi:MAG TPA: hypothetical protein VGC90_07840 [Candidatus Limnocylindrales bacterium]
MRLRVLSVLVLAVLVFGAGWSIANPAPSLPVLDKHSHPVPTPPYRFVITTCSDRPDPRERSHTPQCQYPEPRPREFVSPAQRVDLLQRR